MTSVGAFTMIFDDPQDAAAWQQEHPHGCKHNGSTLRYALGARTKRTLAPAAPVVPPRQMPTLDDLLPPTGRETAQPRYTGQIRR